MKILHEKTVHISFSKVATNKARAIYSFEAYSGCNKKIKIRKKNYGKPSQEGGGWGSV